MREAFEAWWFETENYSMRAERISGTTDAAWAAWQAATERAAQICDEPAQNPLISATDGKDSRTTNTGE